MESVDYIAVADWQKTTGINFNLPDGCNINTVNAAYWNFTKDIPPPAKVFHQPDSFE